MINAFFADPRRRVRSIPALPRMKGAWTVMRTRWIGMILLACLLACLCCNPSRAADPIQLPSPAMEGGKPLMQALKERKSMRAFNSEKIPAQILSNLLWAAFGINRPDGRRTAPSARNWQEVEIYVANSDGLYLWDAQKNLLLPIAAGDKRSLTGTQDYVREAAVNLIFVADYSRIGAGGQDRDMLVGADVGFISQNVYLFCASEGLATVVRASIDRDSLARELRLKSDQKIILAQSVGYPKP